MSTQTKTLKELPETPFSNVDFTLTVKEQKFIQLFLANNGCAANNAETLLVDNFSCQCMEDFDDGLFEDYSIHSVSALLGSLEKKAVIFCDVRSGKRCKSTNSTTQFNFEPDLYWVTESYLKSLNPETKFDETKK